MDVVNIFCGSLMSFDGAFASIMLHFNHLLLAPIKVRHKSLNSISINMLKRFCKKNKNVLHSKYRQHQQLAPTGAIKRNRFYVMQFLSVYMHKNRLVSGR